MSAALITGAARRLGAAMAHALAADGWFVFVHCSRSVAAAEATVAAIRAAGGQAQVVVADLADAEATDALLPRCAAHGPPVTLLVNNASRFDYDDPHTVQAAALDAHFAINARAPIQLARALAQALPEGLTGHVVNMLDSKLDAPDPDYFSYTISKFALQGATAVLARGLAPRVRVNAIAPGAVLPGPELDAPALARTAALMPLNRVPQPGEIVAALRYLVSSPALTGVILPVDAGRRLAGLPRDVAFLT